MLVVSVLRAHRPVRFVVGELLGGEAGFPPPLSLFKTELCGGECHVVAREQVASYPSVRSSTSQTLNQARISRVRRLGLRRPTAS